MKVRNSCPDKINRYITKLSGPLLDRIDMHITVQALTEDELIAPHQSSSLESASIRALVTDVRQYQLERQGCINAHLGTKECERVCQLGRSEQAFLKEVLGRLRLSGRGFHRLLKVARTIADRRFADKTELPDLQQALSFKQLLQEL